MCEATEKNEEGTLSYNILTDTDDVDEERIKTLEVYTDEKYLWDSHAKSEAVTGNKERNGGIRIELDLVFLKRVGGYFWKG